MVGKKGFLFSLGAIFIVLVMLLFFQSYLEKEDYNTELDVEENKFLLYNDFSEDMYKKYFSSQMRIVTVQALINETLIVQAEPAFVMRNISNDTMSAIETGYIRSWKILPDGMTLGDRLNRTHSLLPQGYSYGYNITSYELNQSAWNNMTVFFNVRYSLHSPRLSFERTFNDTIVMPLYNLHLFGDRISPKWVEDATFDAECVFRHMNDTYDCQGVHGTNNSET